MIARVLYNQKGTMTLLQSKQEIYLNFFLRLYIKLETSKILNLPVICPFNTFLHC